VRLDQSLKDFVVKYAEDHEEMKEFLKNLNVHVDKELTELFDRVKACEDIDRTAQTERRFVKNFLLGLATAVGIAVTVLGVLHW
jgi:hypothetical protein